MRMEMSFPRELEMAKKQRWPLCIPVGVTEYHAEHCSLGTDTIIPLELLYRFEKMRNIVIAPPIWYGPASYCVAGPEKNSINVDCDVFDLYMYNILKPLIYGGWRNIYMFVLHQCETHNPTEIACLKAAKKLLFEFLQDTRGIGWWGKRENSDFAATLDNSENPWNWFKVLPVIPRYPGKEIPLDHAGQHETSLLWALSPEAVDIGRCSDNQEWFTETAPKASIKKGEKLIKIILDYWLENVK